MRFYIWMLSFLMLMASHAVLADSIDLKAATENNESVFYLQAGAFSQKANAENQQNALKSKTQFPITIRYLEDKKLYTVSIGPIKDYQEARQLKSLIEENNTVIPDDAVTAKADAPIEPKKSSHGHKKLWNLRNADIRAVVTEVSRVTGKNFIVDPRVQGKISIISSTPINDKELYQVFLAMLQVSGYAAIPGADVVKIIPNIDAKTQAADLLSTMKQHPKGEEMLVEVIPVKYVPADQLVPVLRPLMPQWSSVSAYNPSNMLILSGRAANIHRLADIIQQVDSSSANDIDMVPLRYALAMDVANTLKDLVKTQGGGPGRAQTMLAADDRSNAILISGSKTERIRLRMLINKLDRRSPEGTNSNTQVIYLNYMRAEDMLPILSGIARANFSGNVGTTVGSMTRPALDSTNPASNLASGGSSAGGTNALSANNGGAMQAQGSGMGGAAAAGTTTTSNETEGSTKPTVQIIAEPNTNAIILNAPPALNRIFKKVISQIDIKPAQILVEALVAEIDEDDANSLGIEWGTLGQTGAVDKFRPGFAIVNSKTSINDLQAQIYALARQRRANILSTPSVVVLDNRQAKILVGKQVTIASTSYPNNAGGTTTASPFTTFNRVNVALHLYVRPQITRGQGIQMQIDQGNDTLDPTSEVANSDKPVFKISSIVTSVHVDSGDIVVLGGLNQDGIGNDNKSIPILGDIPGVGRFFQHNIKTNQKRVLMVFIKPIILRNNKDAYEVTGGKYEPVRDYQLEMAREQEIYDPRNSNPVLPPLKDAKLPIPFAHPPQPKVIVRGK